MLSAGKSLITSRVVVFSDIGRRFQENKLNITETPDGCVMVNVETYNQDTGRYDSSGVVEIRSGYRGGKKQELLLPLRKFMQEVLRLKKSSPMVRVDGWGKNG